MSFLVGRLPWPLSHVVKASVAGWLEAGGIGVSKHCVDLPCLPPGGEHSFEDH